MKTAREYRENADDLRALQRLAQAVWRLDARLVEHTVGELAWSTRQHVGRESEWRRRLWFAGSDLAAWGWIYLPSTLEWQVDPSRPELLDDILDWFDAKAGDGRRQTTARAANEDAVERLRRRGYEQDRRAPWIRLNVRDLEHIEEQRLPEGYQLRTVRGDEDLQARVAVHRAAFQPSRVNERSYASVMRTWPYDSDLDCVVEVPDGSFAVYALAWYDDDTRVGELEPVGTHPAHRRRGLARAVNLFALERLKEVGGECAIVACRGDDAYPVPRLLYKSIGFSELTRSLPFALN